MRRRMTSLGLMQIFLALMLVIVLMFVSTYMVYRNSISGIYEEVSDKNSMMMQSTVQAFDNSFRVVNNLIHTIHIMPGTDSLRSMIDDSTDMSIAYTMIEHIANLSAPYDFIEEVAVFYDDSDIVVTTKGTNRFDYFFDKKYLHETYNADYWRNYMRSKKTYKVFPASPFTVNTGENSNQHKNKKLLVVTGGNKLRSSGKNVLVLIDLEALLKHVNQGPIFSGGSMMILDQNRDMLMSTDDNWNLVDALSDAYFGDAGEVTVKRQDYEYRILKSDYNDFIYMERLPYQFANVDAVAGANLKIMLTAGVCAIILSLLLSVYLNNPVKRILKQLGGGNSKGNDFRKILSGIVRLQSENEDNRRQKAYADEELRRSTFLQTLDGLPHETEQDIRMQTYYADFYRHKHFVMALVQVGRLANESAENWTIEDMERRMEQGLGRDGLAANAFHAGHLQFIVMLGVERLQERSGLIKQLRTSLTRLQKEEFSGFSLWACVSALYTSNVSNCRRAYLSVQGGSLYRAVNDDSPVMDVAEIQYKRLAYYPIEKMEKLSHYLMIGKLQEATQLIRETIRENAERRIHYHQMIHLANSMFFYMVGHTEGSARTGQELYELERQFMQRLEQAPDYAEMENALLDAARELAGYAKQEENGRKLNPSFIAQYIELHYMRNLYLDEIAAVAGTTPKYFSNYFKKTFGVNYVEYLNKIRLTHARELLKDSQLSIAEIGERIGYLNSSTFTTTFKKYYGTSPSEYRKLSNE
jgi:two-component system response regulator YesN